MPSHAMPFPIGDRTPGASGSEYLTPQHSLHMDFPLQLVELLLETVILVLDLFDLRNGVLCVLQTRLDLCNKCTEDAVCRAPNPKGGDDLDLRGLPIGARGPDCIGASLGLNGWRGRRLVRLSSSACTAPPACVSSRGTINIGVPWVTWCCDAVTQESTHSGTALVLVRTVRAEAGLRLK